MAITINGDGTLTGISVGGLPDGIVDTDMLATDAVSAAKLQSTAIAVGDLPTGSILQVVSATKTDTFSSTSTAATAITGLKATITPTSTSSKILVMANLFSGNAENYYGNHFYLYYNNGSSTSVIADATGDTAGSRRRASGAYRPANTSQMGNVTIQYLHSPAKNTEIYYQIYITTESSSYTAYVNRTGNDSDSLVFARAASTVTLLEVAA